jgi:hypothetical protein
MNGKQARRHRHTERSRIEQTLAAARTATPEYVATLATHDEVWSVGPLLCVIPPLMEDFPPAVKDAVDRRRRATLSGQCDCGGKRRLLKPRHLVLEHEHNCPASDDNLTKLGARHGLKFKRWLP